MQILTLCIQETPKQASFTNSAGPDEMRHNAAAFHEGLYCLIRYGNIILKKYILEKYIT